LFLLFTKESEKLYIITSFFQAVHADKRSAISSTNLIGSYYTKKKMILEYL